MSQGAETAMAPCPPHPMVWGQTTHPSQLLQAAYTYSGCFGTQNEYEPVLAWRDAEQEGPGVGRSGQPCTGVGRNPKAAVINSRRAGRPSQREAALCGSP